MMMLGGCLTKPRAGMAVRAFTLLAITRAAKFLR
jgi:hypothetical protein